MTKLMVFNRAEEYMGSVKTLLSAKHTIELNGEDFLDFETIDTNIEKGFRILYHDRDIDKFYEFIVQEKDEYKKDGVIINYIYADNSLSETIGDYIKDKRIIKQKANNAIEKALESTRWQAGEIDENDYIGTINFYRTNARAAINSIVDKWWFEIETVITYNKSTRKIIRKINFLNTRGKQRGNSFTYTRDLINIKRKTLPGDVITAMRGFGKGEEKESGGFGRRISFADVNNGKDYIEDVDVKNIWGRVNNNGERIHTFATVEFDDIDDKQRLLDRTYLELGRRKFPQISYTANIIDFFRLTKSTHDYIELGDTIRVIDREFTPNIDYTNRVIKITKDLINIENTEIILGQLVRNLSDRNLDVDKELAGKLDDWGDDKDEDWDPGELTEYEKSADLVKANPSLGIGLSSWVDINENDSISVDGSGRVGQLYDSITEELVYSQDIKSRKPITRNMNGRRWLSFNPDPMVLNRWKKNGGERPIDSIKQEGELLNYLKFDDDIKSFFIVYYDRTPTPISGNSISSMFRVGTSCPLGHEFSKLKYIISAPWATRSIEDKTFVNDSISSDIARKRDEIMYHGRNTKVGESINIYNLGMNKANYDDWMSSSADGNRTELYSYEINTFFTGEISEIILYKRELDSTERNVIINYIKNKYIDND